MASSGNESASRAYSEEAVGYYNASDAPVVTCGTELSGLLVLALNTHKDFQHFVAMISASVM